MPKPRLLILCEGEVTEPAYIRGLARSSRAASVEVIIAKEQGVPFTLVKLARDKKRAAELAARKQSDEFLRYDEVWCVFDMIIRILMMLNR